MALTKQDLGSIRGIVKEEIIQEIAPLRKGLEQEIKRSAESLRQEFKMDISSEVIPLRHELKELREDVSALREQIQSLTITLDNFLKRLTDREEEFVLLKAEVDQIKSVLKQRLGVEIAIQK